MSIRVAVGRTQSERAFPAECITTCVVDASSERHPPTPVDATFFKENFYGQLAFPRTETSGAAAGCVNPYGDTGVIVLCRGNPTV